MQINLLLDKWFSI